MKRISVVAAGVLVVLAIAGVAGALAPLPTPGSPTTISKLVAASVKLKVLPTAPIPTVTALANDQPSTYLPTARNGSLTADKKGCITLTTAGCSFGDLASKKTVVLFGDSHAWMWLPAINEVGKKQHFKVDLLSLAACPAAEVLQWVPSTGANDSTTCGPWRLESIAAISKLKPALVLLGERTAETLSAPGVYFTDAQWKAGLEKTMKPLKTKTTNVALIGDITVFAVSPPACLASYPTNLKSCLQSTTTSTPQFKGHEAAEASAAKAEGIKLINPMPWLCTKSDCSFVVGTYLVYFDSTHVSATFAEYLSNEFGPPIKALL
jgi:hypothetical protein